MATADGCRLSFGQMAERVEAWVRWADHLPPGPIGVATGNCAAFVELFLALARLGRPMVSLERATNLVDLDRRAAALGCTVVLHRLEVAPPRDETAGAPVAPGAPDPRIAVRPLDSSASAPVPPPGTVLVKHTSGSTGEPLGLCLGEDSLLAGIEQIGRGMALTETDRVLLAIPLSHSYGFDNGVLSLAVLGTPLILEASTYPHSLLHSLAVERATFLPVVPPLVHFLSQSDWPEKHQLRTVICAGGRLEPESAQRFRERTGLPIHQFYGSTETGGISFERYPEHPDAVGTVGHPLPGVRIELGEEGRVVVHSAANHGGVLGEATVLDPGPVVVGDLAEWTPQGRLRIVGRAADFVNISGRRLSIASIERCLNALPGIDGAAVLATDDPVRGERLVAFVVGEPHALGATDLPIGLTPRDLRPIAALPYTERGKLDRRALRQWVGADR